jgi:hypothetical protein
MAMIDTIRALLAKAESTTFEEERATYMAKATELMRKHAIDLGMLAAAGNRADDDVIECRVLFADMKGTQFIKAKRELMWGLVALNRCRVVQIGKNGRDQSWVYGFRADLDFIDMMFASIVVQMMTAMNADRPSYATRTWAVSFAHGYVRRVIARLRDAQTAATTSDAPGTAVVLRDRSSEVNAFVANRLPNVRQRRIQSTSDRDMSGYMAGDHAGFLADLGGNKVTGGRTALGD